MIKYSPQSNLKIVYLPPNTTGYLQPADQLCFAIFKKRYRKFVADFLHEQSESDKSISQVPEKDAVCKAVSLINGLEKRVIQGIKLKLN